MDRDKLVALALRVEAATGADRELDAEIVRAIYPDALVCLYEIGDEDPTVFHAEPLIRNKSVLPSYTASIDAAMTLVPGGCWAEGSLASPGALEIHAPMTYDPLGRGWAATPALALCSASLRALAAIEAGHG